MKAERLIELICHPEKIESNDLLELDTLVNRYPYFQAARVLYLKALNTFASVRFRNELKSNTIHITNHKQLYKYLHNLIEFDYLHPDCCPKNDTLSDIVTERIKEINGYIPVNTFGVPANKINKPATNVPEKEQRDTILEVDFFQKPEKPKTETQIPKESSIEKVISNPIILDNIPGMITDYSDSGRTTVPQNEYEIVRHSGSQTYVIEPVKGGKEVEVTEFSETPEIIYTTEETITMASFEFIGDDEAQTNVRIQPKPEEVISEITEEYLAPLEEQKQTTTIFSPVFYSLEDDNDILEDLSVTELVGQLRKKQPKKATKDLIEKFIQKEPNIPKGRLPDADNRDLSVANRTEQGELFSETLAKIYIRQQLYDKAIATYIKLSLKYPEKSVYFANRIEKIKDKINDAAQANE